MRRPRLSPQQITLLLTIVAFVGGIAANIASGELPEAWAPYLWIAWPITVVFFVLTIVLTVWGQRELPDPHRQRSLLLAKSAARIRQSLSDKLAAPEQRIDLALRTRPHAVLPQPGRRLERGTAQSHRVPDGTAINQVFRDCGRALLILGEPGAGKSTLLLELADALAQEAEADVQAPLPVVLSLDSWATSHRKLEDWLASEVSRSYSVGIDLARGWVAEDALLPLLDGLDEVAAARRDECVAEINAFRQRQQQPSGTRVRLR
jgi:heme exporter protein D